MDDVKPDDVQPEELLSAYLEGEVTGAQRAQVERMLATDLELRAALEELRALSSAIQSLPRLTIGEDLSERILRKAERAMLERQSLEPAAVTAAPLDVETAHRSAAPRTGSRSPSNSTPTTLDPTAGNIHWSRRLAWPLAAVAATLLIMLVVREPKPEVAQAPADSAPRVSARMNATPSNAAFESAPANEGDLLATADQPSWENVASSLASDAHSEFQGANADKSARNSIAMERDALRFADEKSFSAPAQATPPTKHSPRERGELESQSAIAGAAPPKPATAIHPAEPAASLATSSAARAELEHADSRDRDAQALSLEEQLSEWSQGAQMVVEVETAFDVADSLTFETLLARQNIQFDELQPELARKQFAQLGGGGGSNRRAVAADDRRQSGVAPQAGATPHSDAATREGERHTLAGGKLNPAQESPALAGKKDSKDSPSLELADESPASRLQEKASGKFGQARAGAAEIPLPAGELAAKPSQAEQEGGTRPASPSQPTLKDASVDSPADLSVDVVLVTATPSQLLALLREMEHASPAFRASSLTLSSKEEQAAAGENASRAPPSEQAPAEELEARLELESAKRKANDADALPAAEDQLRKEHRVADGSASVLSDRQSGRALRLRLSESQLPPQLPQPGASEPAGNSGPLAQALQPKREQALRNGVDAIAQQVKRAAGRAPAAAARERETTDKDAVEADAEAPIASQKAKPPISVEGEQPIQVLFVLRGVSASRHGSSRGVVGTSETPPLSVETSPEAPAPTDSALPAAPPEPSVPDPK